MNARDYPCWRLDFDEVSKVAARAKADADYRLRSWTAPSDGSMQVLEDRRDANGWRYQCAIVRDERIRRGLFLSLGACPPEGGPPAVLIELAYEAPAREVPRRAVRRKGRK